MQPTVELVYFNAGGGHRASALALQARLAVEQPGWHVRLTDLFAVLDPQSRYRRLTGSGPEDLYNARLRRGWTLGLGQELRIFQGMVRLAHPVLRRQLADHWHHTRPDMVVSLIPNFNRAMAEGLAVARPWVPYVTLMTDLADCPPAFWIEPGPNRHVVCGTHRAARQAQEQGMPEAAIHRTSGMMLHPDFHDRRVADRDVERRRMGLDPTLPTGLVSFGGYGAPAMLRIARSLPDVQLILVAGHNAPLATRLRAAPSGAPRCVLGYTGELPFYMELADFFIGKPGPGSLSEAIHKGLPVIVARNAWTMPQERYNTDWVRDEGLGLVVPGFSRIDRAVASLLRQLPALRAGVARQNNRAIFEVPVILAEILGGRTIAAAA